MTDGPKIQQLPPALNEADRQEVERLTQMLVELQRIYAMEAEPIVKRIADIQARYMPQYVIVPSSETTN